MKDLINMKKIDHRDMKDNVKDKDKKKVRKDF